MGAMRGTTRTQLSVLDQGRGGSGNDADRVWYEEGTAGSGRALVFTIPFSASVLRSNSERVSLIYRNDDGVNAGTDSTGFHVDGAESIAR